MCWSFGPKPNRGLWRRARPLRVAANGRALFLRSSLSLAPHADVAGAAQLEEEDDDSDANDDDDEDLAKGEEGVDDDDAVDGEDAGGSVLDEDDDAVLREYCALTERHRLQARRALLFLRACCFPVLVSPCATP